MIKANEIRIGNYIQVGGNTLITYQTYKPHKVNADIIKEIAEENEERGNDYILSVYQPIKLTPEILKKCGFAKRVNPTNVQCERDVDGYTIFVCFDTKISIWISEKDDEDYPEDDNSGIHVKHKKFLHELQNICFDLTGTELEIKLHEKIQSEQ